MVQVHVAAQQLGMTAACERGGLARVHGRANLDKVVVGLLV